MEIFGLSEIYLSPFKGMNNSLHWKFYVDYEHTDHNKTNFTNCENLFSSYRAQFSLLIHVSIYSTLIMAHTLLGDLISQLKKLELISNSSSVKLKLLIFHAKEMFITVVLQTCFSVV